MDSIRFANLTFRGLRRKQLLEPSDSLRLIVTVNAEIIVDANRASELKKIIDSNFATLDGQWPYVLARLRTGRKDIEKISGSDFSLELCRMAAERGYRVFLLGARPEVNLEAQRRLRRSLQLDISGFSPPQHPYPFPAEMDQSILQKIEEWKPAVLIIAFGAPKQELWASQHYSELERIGVRWCLGAGGSLDFISGAIRRAPVFLQKAGLESVWRLVLQPKVRFVRILRALRFLQYA